MKRNVPEAHHNHKNKSVLVGIAATSLFDNVYGRQLLLQLSVCVPKVTQNPAGCDTNEAAVSLRVASVTATSRPAPPGGATQRLFTLQDLLQLSLDTAFVFYTLAPTSLLR